MARQVHHMEDMDNYDSNEMLVDSNMIPPVEMEVVMSGDGNVEQEYAPSPQYQYEYYEEQEMPPPQDYKFPVATISAEPRRDWKTDQKLKMDLYEILDALPTHLHGKYIRMFEKRGIVLDNTKRSETRYNSPVPSSSSKKKNSTSLGFYYNTERSGNFSNYSGGVDTLDEPDFLNHPETGRRAVSPTVYQMDYEKMQQREANSVNSRLCTGCNMVLRRSVYYHHARMIRERGACNLFTPQRFPCPQCDSKIGTLEKLCLHMEQIHGAPTQIKTAVFTSEDQFVEFRLELEGKGGNFRMARGNKKNKKGIVQYFRCNRLQTLAKNNTYRLVDNPAEEDLPTNKRLGKLNLEKKKRQSSKQVIRTENSCTAFYNKAYLDNGTIEIRYCDHHLHEDEKLRLPESVRLRVLELARKNLPHVVVLMIVKDERYKYCAKNSANDRRILEMKTQDIRQILAGINRQEKVKMKRVTQTPKARIRIVDHGDGILLPDEQENPDWYEFKTMSSNKVNRSTLSALEIRYLDLFENNRDEITLKLHDRVKAENEKRTYFESFIHRTAAAQDMFKNLDASKITPTLENYGKLERALEIVQAMQETFCHARKEPKTQMQQTFLEMMEEKEREATHHDLGMARGSMVEEDVDVVGGVDESSYMERHQPILMKKSAYETVQQIYGEGEENIVVDEIVEEEEVGTSGANYIVQEEEEENMMVEEVVDEVPEASSSVEIDGTSEVIGGETEEEEEQQILVDEKKEFGKLEEATTSEQSSSEDSKKSEGVRTNESNSE